MKNPIGVDALRVCVGLAGLVIGLDSHSVSAAETWYCEYSAYRPHETKDQSWFRVDGNKLIENSGDVIVDYQIVAGDEDSIVAAKGGSHASDPWVMGFLLLIRKKTGDFILETTSFGEPNGRQTGHCQLVTAPTSNRGPAR